MKTAKRIVTAVAFATASLLAQGAMAADVSTETALSLPGATTYGHAFSIDNASNSFADRYTFSVGAGGKVTADVFSLGGTDLTGLDILGLSLFNTATGLVLKGTQLSTGTIDIWSLKSAALTAGDYLLLVSGTVLSNDLAGYSGTATVTAVPEPATYGMLLGGLGLIGAVAARRRKV
jgi:hypothetical protein